MFAVQLAVVLSLVLGVAVLASEPDCHVVAYQIRDVSRPTPTKIGDALYEKGGSRFVYRISYGSHNGQAVFVGFDDHEYWIAVLEEFATIVDGGKRPIATYMIRYDSCDSLSHEFSHNMRFAFFGHPNGKALLLRLAVLEDIAHLIGVRNGGAVTGTALRAAAGKIGCVTQYDPSHPELRLGKRHLDRRFTYFAISVAKLDKVHVWDYFVELDPKQNDSIVSITAGVSLRWIGGDTFGPLPGAPYPLRFEIRPRTSRQMRTSVFSAQHYLGPKTKVMTFQDDAKEDPKPGTDSGSSHKGREPARRDDKTPHKGRRPK